MNTEPLPGTESGSTQPSHTTRGRRWPGRRPRELLRSVVLVYSNVASRRFAMADFSAVTTIRPDATPNNDDRAREHQTIRRATAAHEGTSVAAAEQKVHPWDFGPGQNVPRSLCRHGKSFDARG